MQNAELSKNSSLAEFPAEAVNTFKIIFDRGVYVGKNTSQAASVESVCCSKQIMHAADCKSLLKSP
jgi:hypothetical protein